MENKQVLLETTYPYDYEMCDKSSALENGDKVSVKALRVIDANRNGNQ